MFHAHSRPRSGGPARRLRRSTIALFVALLSLSTLSAFSAGAAPAPKGATLGSDTLKKDKQAVFWNGVVGPEDAPKGGEPPECQTVTCDHFQLTIDLPSDTFSDPQRPGGIQVALRWPTEFDTLNLFVYKDGGLRGASAGIIATAQSLLLPSPENGTYDVWIQSDPDYSLNVSVAYEALAEVELDPPIQPIRRLLPDLEFRGTHTITFDTPSFPLFEADPPPGSSCFNSEAEEKGAQNCLRFDQIIANVGQAPLELRFAIPKDPSDTSNDVFERVYSSDKSYADQIAGFWEWHETHHHYHYTSFASTALWHSDKHGDTVGTNPVRESEKVSFCIADIKIDAWGKKGDGPRKYFAPDCLFPQDSDANFNYLIQGLSNGWSDVYEWYLPDQYIEVSGVPDGYYLMVFCADPDSEIEEASETNNCSKNLIHLDNMGTPQKSVTNLGPIP